MADWPGRVNTTVREEPVRVNRRKKGKDRFSVQDVFLNNIQNEAQRYNAIPQYQF